MIMNIVPLEALHLPPAVHDKLAKASFQHTGHIDDEYEKLRFLNSSELFEVVLRLAFFNLKPRWIGIYFPPVVLDQRGSTELHKARYKPLTSAFTRAELWDMLRVISCLDGKDYVCRATPGGGIEVWRK